MKKILGLDLGTNSIGWSLVNQDYENKNGEIIGLGSRIIPMSQEIINDFNKGVSISQTASRTGYRGVRRLLERNLLRRERLHRVLNILGFLPKHYAAQIDFEKKLGQFISNSEPKLAYKGIKTSENKIQYEFVFKKAFEEMLEDFKIHQPNLVLNEKKVPYDWTIYYLRKKALTAKIEKEELAWLLLHFNQKRGYYQLRGEEEEETPNKLVEFHTLKVADVTADEQQKGKTDIWYNVILENGWIYRRASKTPLFDWKGKVQEFIVTTELNDDKSIKLNKDGNEKRSFKAVDSEVDWVAIKKSTEEKIDKSKKTVGCYIYETLLQNPNQKIKGKLVRTIERKFYKDELKQILEKQVQEHPELKNSALYSACIEELYENNTAHRENIKGLDFIHLFMNDILFYQRPLKSKKSLISDCPFEQRTYLKDGKKEIQSIKCISKSHPLFQEFRLWQFIQNIKIYQKEKIIDGKTHSDVNVTDEFLTCEEDYTNLFEWLNERKDIEQKAFLKYPAFNLKKNSENYRWNYVEDKSYPCNETHNAIVNRLSKVQEVHSNFLTKEKEQELWHILYSVEDKIEIERALKSFAIKNNLSEDFADVFKKIKPFDKDYGAYSEKAIKKLLPLMRMGKYWQEEAIHSQTKNRIEKIINGEVDEKIRDRVRDKAIHLSTINDFKALPLWLTSYIVYDRHSEDSNAMQWKKPEDIENFLKEFKQHSLRNPIVEQVITETLRVVKDIWKTYGNGDANFFDEIHIELGREMKNPADKRKDMTNKMSVNENTNLRIKALLSEFLNDTTYENVRPYSPSQQEILKIYEEGVLNSDIEIEEDILKITKSNQPTKSELNRYKLWLEQKYRSPYTGEIIPLNKLFTPAFEIEHIIPQSRYFDDSLSNKVICEAEVNKDKDKSTAYEYIRDNHGKKIELSFGKVVTIFGEKEYEDFVKRNYSKNRGKLTKLMMEEIPESFIQRQLNDSRYISKVVKNLLSSLVREDDEQESTSKHVISCNGNITNELKKDWGLNDIWNDIVSPRFERLNDLTKSTNFGEWTNKNGKRVFQTQVPLELQKGFNKKRIDHRHHALDALIIACASKNHVNYLNNQYAKSETTRYDLQKKLRRHEQIEITDKKTGEKKKINVAKEFFKPWDNFTIQAKESLENTVVSFKQNLRVINKTVNYYQSFKNEDGSLRLNKNGMPEKEIVKQAGNNWAIRKPMHTPMPYGKRNFDFDILKISENIGKREHIIDEDIKKKVNTIYEECGKKTIAAQNFIKQNPIQNNEGMPIIETAFKISVAKFRKRQPISKLSNRGQGGIKTPEDMIKFINKVADSKLRNDLLAHLNASNNDIELAFNSDGIDAFNSKRKNPVLKLPIAENGDKRFSLGNRIGSKHKWMEAAEGTNLFFAIYKVEKGKRNYETIPLNIVIENQKQGALQNIKPELCSVPNKNEKGDSLLFHLSPNDLVYVPTNEELENPNLVDLKKLSKVQQNRIMKFVSCTGGEGHFVPNYYSSPIMKNEIGTNNKSEKTFDGIQIKSVCWKIKTDRLGKISIVLK
jgi:CRISPR-associated endonuclease Csn1